MVFKPAQHDSSKVETREQEGQAFSYWDGTVRNIPLGTPSL